MRTRERIIVFPCGAVGSDARGVNWMSMAVVKVQGTLLGVVSVCEPIGGRFRRRRHGELTAE
jgi:hypothetical protein